MSNVNLPFDPSDKKNESEYAAQNADTANFISKGWYYYTWPMFQQARRKMCAKQPLKLGDTFLLTKDENVKDASERFHKFLAEDIAEALKEGVTTRHQRYSQKSIWVRHAQRCRVPLPLRLKHFYHTMDRAAHLQLHD